MDLKITYTDDDNLIKSIIVTCENKNVAEELIWLLFHPKLIKDISSN